MDDHCPELHEALLVWGLYAANATAIFVTHSRIAPEHLYNVSHRGIAGGASRALVFSNFSASLAAIALDGFAAAHLLAHPTFGERRRRGIKARAALAAMLCLGTAVPGVVDQRDLDAKPINAVPALGVATALALTVEAVRSGGVGPKVRWSRRDATGLASIAGFGVISLPWILAEFGVYVGDVPLLKRFVMSKEPSSPDDQLCAVHLGHHHGLDGALLAVTSLLLGRGLKQLPPGFLRAALSWYLSLMLSYGAANTLNDAWHEQVEKRGRTVRRFPNLLRPDLSIGWGLLLLGMAILRFLVFHPEVAATAAPTDPAASRPDLETEGAA
jgi:hypothetical protein